MNISLSHDTSFDQAIDSHNVLNMQVALHYLEIQSCSFYNQTILPEQLLSHKHAGASTQGGGGVEAVASKLS